MIINVFVVFKYPLFSSDFDEIWIFSTYFRKNTQILNFMTIRPVGTETLHAGGRTDRDMTKLKDVFRNFANAPKSSSY